jgi:hypothetical protein
VMGNQSLVVCLSQSRDLTKACDAVGHHNIGLHDAVDILFEYPPVFVYAAIVLLCLAITPSGSELGLTP